MLVWDDVGTCRAMNKRGASTVVSSGDGTRKREHAITMNSILNGMQRTRTPVSLVVSRRRLLRTFHWKRIFQKILLHLLTQTCAARQVR